MRFSDSIRWVTRAFCAGLLVVGALHTLSHRTSGLRAQDNTSATTSMEQAQNAIQAGVQSYQDGLARNDKAVSRVDFQRAAASFLEAVEILRTRSNPDLYRNLGHAAVQAGDRGLAIWSYRQSLELQPRNENLLANLDSLRSELPDWARTSAKPTRSFIDHGLEYLARGWTYAVFGIPAFAILLSLYVVSKREIILYLALATLGIGTMGWWQQRHPFVFGPGREGVVLGEDSQIRVADSTRAAATIRQSVPPGTEVRIVEGRADWLQIELPRGERGWIPAIDVREVATHG